MKPTTHGNFTPDGSALVLTKPLLDRPWMNVLSNGAWCDVCPHLGGGYSFLGKAFRAARKATQGARETARETAAGSPQGEMSGSKRVNYLAGKAIEAERRYVFRKRCSRIKAAFLYLLAAGLMMSSPVQADSNKKPADTKKTQKEKDKEKADKLAAAVDRAVADHLTYLKTYLPQLTEADIKNRSITEIRRLYYDAYRKQGLGMNEATTKAAEEITVEKAEEVTLKKGGSGSPEKKRAEKAARVHFEFLSAYLPNLTPSDVEGRSTEDLRKLYYEAYCKQGQSIVEARKMADEMDFSPEEKKKTEKPADTPEAPVVVDTNFDYLKPFLPWLTPGDLRGKSDADLKNLYFQAYRAQGMSVQEARQTADRLVVVKLSSEDDPYSLAPGQIASTMKTTAENKPTPTPSKKGK